MVIQYKCPNCGADMAFDSKSGKLHCESCGRYEDIEKMPTPDIPEGEASHDEPKVNPFNPDEIEDEKNFEYEYDNESDYHRMFGSDEVKEYHCNNCGAIILTDKDTTATTCSFCGAGVVLGDRLSGTMAPTKIIPFKISKAEAQEKFVKWCHKGRLTPKGFMTADRIKSISGMYVPFWLYDLNGKGDVDATCTRVRTYSRGEYIYTETSFYHVYRKVDLNYLKIPVDASEKMPDGLMDKLEPYQYSDLKEFNLPYLSGYLSEKYSYDDKQLFPRVQQKARQFVDSYMMNTIHGYSSVITNRKDISIGQRKAFYTLLPVWMVCYDYKDAEHIFAMNGQTGKIVGKPPLSKGRMAQWFGGISLASFVVIKLIVFLLGGGLI